MSLIGFGACNCGIELRPSRRKHQIPVPVYPQYHGRYLCW